MKKYTCVIVAMLLVILVTGTTFAAKNGNKIDVIINMVNVQVNEESIYAKNFLYNGSTYISIRAISEALGKKIVWDANTNTINITDYTDEEGTIIMTATMEEMPDPYNAKIDAVPNKVNILVNGTKVKENNFLYEGTTYVPLRAISEMLDKEVLWDQETSTVIIITEEEVGFMEKWNQIADNVNEKAKKDEEEAKILNANVVKETTSIKNPITKADLPYEYHNANGMSIIINSYEVSGNKATFNFTFKNNIVKGTEGKLHVRDYFVFADDALLERPELDDNLKNIEYLQPRQSITGNVYYDGLPDNTKKIIISGFAGKVNQDEVFNMVFKIE